MSETTQTLIVPEDADGERLDRFLARSLPQYSREYIKQLIKEGRLQIDEKTGSKPALALREGQELNLVIPETVPLALEAENLPVTIVYEDDHLLVVDKPAGMLTHPSPKEQTGTLVNALLYHCNGGLSGINGVERPGIVHRLDRDTTGLLMIAKTDPVHRGLQRQIQERSLKRCYRTLVQGEMNDIHGSVDAPIGRNPKNRDKMAVVEGGRHAVTHWSLEEALNSKFSHLRVRLETGRTHQIRVHMAYIHHPVFMDPLYGSGVEKTMGYKNRGQVLQAYQLGFVHPVTQETLSFELEPDERFVKALEFIRRWIQ